MRFLLGLIAGFLLASLRQEPKQELPATRGDCDLFESYSGHDARVLH